MLDIEIAVTTLIKGVAPGVKPGYLPPPAVVGSECRRQMNLRLDREHRERRLRPALPPPDIEHSPESRANVKAMVEQAVANIAEVTRTDDAAATLRRNQQWDRTHERFMPEMDEHEIARRLGFTTGDPEDHEAAA